MHRPGLYPRLFSLRRDHGFVAVVACAALLAAVSTRAFSRPVEGTVAASADPTAMMAPFKVGERLTFNAKVNFLNAGSATMHVLGIEVVRGVPVYHTTFDIRGRVLFKTFNEHFESWFDTATYSSMRHVQDVDQGENPGHNDYEFFWQRQIYIKNGVEHPSVSAPIDEGSFLYVLRTLSFRMGATDTLARYYHADRNPIVYTVERKEHITVPAGDFDAIVLQPVIKSKGLFSVDSHAEVWLADNPRRTLLQLKSKLSLGTLYLQLASIDSVR